MPIVYDYLLTILYYKFKLLILFLKTFTAKNNTIKMYVYSNLFTVKVIIFDSIFQYLY